MKSFIVLFVAVMLTTQATSCLDAEAAESAAIQIQNDGPIYLHSPSCNWHDSNLHHMEQKQAKSDSCCNKQQTTTSHNNNAIAYQPDGYHGTALSYIPVTYDWNRPNTLYSQHNYQQQTYNPHYDQQQQQQTEDCCCVNKQPVSVVYQPMNAVPEIQPSLGVNNNYYNTQQTPANPSYVVSDRCSCNNNKGVEVRKCSLAAYGDVHFGIPPVYYY